MSQPDWSKQKLDTPDVLVGFYCGGTVHKFALNHTVDYRWSTTWGSGWGYPSANFNMRGTWYGFLEAPLTIRQSVGSSIFSKLNFSSTTLNFLKVDHPAIDALIEDIDSTEGFSNADYYVVIQVCEKNKVATPDTDTVYVGVIEPRTCKITKNKIIMTLKDPAEELVKKNVLDVFKSSDHSNIEVSWNNREAPRMYGDWGDIGAGYHFQYGFDVPMINAGVVHDDSAAGWNWPIFKLADFGNTDMVLDQASGIPDMSEKRAKIWAFWDGSIAYDVWQVRQCEDQTTYPLSEGYVQAVRSMREQMAAYKVWGDDGGENIVSIATAGSGIPVVVRLDDWAGGPAGTGLYSVSDRILFQEVVGTDELNQKWWYVHSITGNLGFANDETEYTLYEKDGTTPTDQDDFSAYTSGGILTDCVPIYKPYEDIGSRDTENELFRFWIQDGENDAVYKESSQNPGSPMENPVEVIYDLLRYVAGVNPSNFDSGWWATYALFDTSGVKARRYISKQMTVKKAIEEICHDFGLMVFTHAGKYHCARNRAWEHASSYVAKELYPKDRVRGSYSEPFDPGREAIRFDWGVRVYYESSQNDQVFTGEELQSIVSTQFSEEQDPLTHESIVPSPHLNDEKYYSTYIFPSADYWDKAEIIELDWVSDEDTAKLMCHNFTAALNATIDDDGGVLPTPIVGYGNRGVTAKIFKRTVDPTYHLGVIYKFWDSTCEPDEYRYGQVYERNVDLDLFRVEEKCYQVSIT